MTRSSLIPGFRFHPTDAELVMYYLKRKLLRKKHIINAVAEVNIYDFSPWDLPDKSSMRSGDLEWFFFCPKARKYSSGPRSNRSTEIGFWKATGKERPVKYKERTVAMIKTLVFHLGTAPNGKRTDWVMHEYCMKDELLANAGIVQDAYVLCKIFKKAGAGPKNGAQYGAPFNEEEWEDDDVGSCSESQAVIGPGGITNVPTHKQNGPATTTITEPGSSMVTFSANETTNALNHKLKGPATMNTAEPGSSTVTFSANRKQKGPATMNTAEPGSSMVTFSANVTTNTLDRKQKGPATMNTTEPGLSTVTFSANGTTNAWDHKQKGPVTFSGIKRCSDALVNDDVLLYEDIALIMGASSTANDDDGLFSEDLIMGVSAEDDNGNNKKEGVDNGKSVAVNEENGIYDNLDDLFNLDDLECNTDGAEYRVAADDFLRDFYVD